MQIIKTDSGDHNSVNIDKALPLIRHGKQKTIIPIPVLTVIIDNKSVLFQIMRLCSQLHPSGKRTYF